MSAFPWREFSPDARRFLLGSVLLELGHAFLWVLQNLYVRSVGLTDVDAGTVLASGAVGVVLTTIPGAALYDRLGARRSLAISCVLAGTSLALLASVESLPLLMLCSALQGSAFTLHRVVAAPFLVSASRPKERTGLFSAEMATHSIASMIGLSTAGLIAGHFEGVFAGSGAAETEALRLTLWLGAAATLLGLPFYLGIRVGGAIEPQRAGAARRKMFAVLAPKHWGLWWRLALPHGLVGLGAGLTIPFINIYFTDRFGVPKSELGAVMASSQLTMTVGVLLIPWTVARLGLLKATILTEILSLPFFLLLAFTTSFPVAVGAFVFRSALMNLSHPIWRNLIMEITPVDWRAAVNGVTMLAWNLGWALSNRWGGVLIETSSGWAGEGTDGYVVPMLITSGVYLLAIVLEAVFFWHVRQLGVRGAGGEVVTADEEPAPPAAAPVAAADAE